MGKDEEALAIFQNMPGPVLPELVEANTAFALLRLGRREEGSTYLRRALQKYPNDLSGNLPAMQALLLASTDSMAAERLIASIGQRKTANPSHHAAYFAACASARLKRASEAVQWLREAASTGFPCYSLFARDPNLDPIRSDPDFQGFMAELQKSSASLRQRSFPTASSLAVFAQCFFGVCSIQYTGVNTSVERTRMLVLDVVCLRSFPEFPARDQPQPH